MGENDKQSEGSQKIMIRINGWFLYQLGTVLHSLGNIDPEQKPENASPTVHFARNWLNSYLNTSVFRPRTSYAKGNELLSLLDEFLKNGINSEKVGYFAYSIQACIHQFETVLAAELGLEDLYLVFQKRGYDNKALIDNATILFPDDLIKKVPEAKFDIDQAGKCIAFELITAAGFHLHRANEAVLHRYYDAVIKGAERPKGRNVGEYIQTLEKEGCGNPKVIAALKSLKDLHRNPLIHPEQSLESIDDAIALLNAIHSVIVHMLKEIPEPEITN